MKKLIRILTQKTFLRFFAIGFVTFTAFLIFMFASPLKTRAMNLLHIPNISTFFKHLLTPSLTTLNLGKGKIIASNVLYGLTTGEGLSVKANGNPQIPTLTNTGVISLQGKNGNLFLTQGSGIGVKGLRITNLDPGSAQKIFETIQVNGTNISAGTNTDIFSITSGSGISLGTNPVTKSLSITNTSPTQWSNNSSDIYYTSGNVGIGDLPSYALDVYSSNGIAGRFSGRVIGANAINTNEFVTLGQLSSGTGQFWQLNSGGLSPATTSNDLLVGGTATSSALFQIFGSGSFAGTATTSGNLTFNANSSFINVVNGGSLAIQTATTGQGDTGLTSRLYIGNNGNIGIGTNNPSTKLYVSGGDIQIDNNRVIRFTDSTGGTTSNLELNNANNLQLFNNSASGNIQIGLNNSSNSFGTIRFYTLNSLERMRIDQNGNVGIGTTTTTGGMLTVAGDIATTQSSINLLNATPTTIHFGGAATTLGIGASTGTTTINNNLSVAGITTLGTIAYTWPTSGQSNGYVLSTNGSGTLSWTNAGGLGTNYWQLANGALAPANTTNDLLLGGTATTSATFGFINIAGGTPTATISSNLSLKVPIGANPAETFNILNGGSLNFQTAGALQGDAGLTSRLFIANGGNIGIGTNNPGALLHVSGGDVLLDNNRAFRIKDTSGNVNAVLKVDASNNLQIFQGATSGNLQIGINNASNASGSIRFYAVAGVEKMRMDASGNLGINTTTPNYKLDTIDTQNSTSSASITNLSTSDTANTNVLDLNLGTATSGTNSRFIQFFAGANSSKNAVGVGRIQLNNGNVAYNTGGADFAEYFSKGTTPLMQGDIVTIDNSGSATLATQKTGAIGIVSTTAGFIGNAPHDETQEAQKIVVGLVGQLPVKVTTENGTIQAGDLLTMSTTPGVAMKATKAGITIGRALEDYTNTNSHAVGIVTVVVNISWADPAVQITDNGDLSVNGQVAGANTQTNSTMLAGDTVPVPSTTGVTANQFNNLSTTVATLQLQMASQTAQLAKIDDLSNQLADLEKTVNLNQALAGISTQSAVLGASTTSEDTTIGGKLSVSGRTLLGDVGITGVVNDGLLTINGMDTSSATPAATINTLSAPLKIQSLAAAGVDFENGKVTIDTNGNLVTQGDITAKTVHADKYEATATGEGASTGEAIIPAGQTSIEIKTTAITNTSKVFVTSEIKGSGQLYVTSKITGKSFKVELDNALNKDDKFNWWVLN